MIDELLHSGASALTALAGVEAGDVLPKAAGTRVVRLDTLADACAGTVDTVLVIARSPTDLRQVMAASRLLPASTTVAVWIVESPSWCPPPSLTRTPFTELHVTRRGHGGWLLVARYSRPCSPGAVLAEVVRTVSGGAVAVLPVVALAGPGLGDWRPGDPRATVCADSGPKPHHTGVPAGEVAVRNTAGETYEWADARVRVSEVRAVGDVSWTRLGSPWSDITPSMVFEPQAVPPVDERTVNPRGFVRDAGHDVGTIVQRAGCWTVESNDTTVASFDRSGAVRDVDVSALRHLRAVRIEWWPGHTGPLAAVRIVAGLAAAGVPLVCESVPGWATALGDDLVKALTSANEEDLDDELRREEHSVRLRRAALRAHGVEARWRHLASAPTPAVSVILCTRRPERISWALAQIGRQRLVDLEVILMLHGVEGVSTATAKEIARFGHPLVTLTSDAGTPFGSALNEAVARTSGQLLAKMDDDDWYGPEHLADLLLARAYTGAELVGAASEFFYLERLGVTVRRRWSSEVMADHVAGGAFLISRSAFEGAGGFRPIARAVDVQLFQAVQDVGGRLYRAHGLSFMARRSASVTHTWQEPAGYFLRSARRQWRGFRPSTLLEAT